MTSFELPSVDGISLDVTLHTGTNCPISGTVVLAHGITVDKDEGGMFLRLADGLARRGLTVIQFSFRGHGRSEGTQRGMTISGEMLDLQAIIEFAVRAHPERLSLVAASFGAVPVSLSLPYLGDQLQAMVLWNPVLDLCRTFVNPELPWGRQNFSHEQQRMLRSVGYLLVDDEFQMGRVLFDEMRLYRPVDCFIASAVPALVVHGDQDTYVSYDIARSAAAARRNCDFHTVRGSDHGFDTRDREDEAIRVTIDWLIRRLTMPT